MKHYSIKSMLSAILSVAIIFPLVVACSDDDEKDREFNFTWPGKGQSQIKEEQNDPVTRTVISHYKPLDKQKHRSSDNFSTKNMVSGKYIQWTVDDGISFDVMIDKTGTDPTYAHSLSNGSRTKYEGDVVNKSNIYIANPSGTKEDFAVTYTIVDEDDDAIYISCASSHLNGQDHRASDNFRLGAANYRVECPAGVKFKIMEDKSAASDPTIYSNLENGSVISQVHNLGNIYIADVTGAKQAILVKLVPYTNAWMSYIADNTQFYSLSIPATHDSGTYTLSSGLAKCQNFNFHDQLDHGIRCFDIRLDGSLKLCHGSGITYTDLHITFDDVLKTFNSWLEDNPTEAILMMIKAESDEDHMRESIKSYFSKNDDRISRIMRGESFPTLGAARGKIVMMRRFETPKGESDANWGINIGAGWPDDATGTYSGPHFKSYIEDRYFSADEAIHDTQKKTDKVKEAITDANSGAYPDYIFLIYNSVAGRISHTPWEYAWGGMDALPINPVMNESLAETLGSFESAYNDKFRTGILFMDFYNKHGNDDKTHLVQRIINSNFGEKKVQY